MLRALWNGFLDLLYPPPINCLYCGGVKLPGDYELCSECIGAIEFIKQPCCVKCGKPVTVGVTYCGNCTGQMFSFERAVPVAIYRGWLKDAINALKFRGQMDLAKPLARMIAGRVAAAGLAFDMIVPVPMHRDRLQLRGYNHADLLAGYIGEFLGIPTCPRALKRHVDTVPQRTLKRSERERNLINVFVVKERELVKSKRVLLVDDIFTTGFTAEGCSAALLEGGAQSVVVCIIAIGLGKSFPYNQG